MNLYRVFRLQQKQTLPILKKGSSTLEALQMMERNGAEALLVVEQATPVGIASKRGFAECAHRIWSNLDASHVDDWMDPTLIELEYSMTPMKALAQMLAWNVNYVLLHRDGQRIGILSKESLLMGLLRQQANRREPGSNAPSSYSSFSCPTPIV